MKKFFAVSRIEAAVMLIVFATAILPLITVNCINGHDLEYHLLRIEALKTGIENGLPFLRVNMLFFGGEGYASSMFYPDFLLYIPALLRVLGIGINLSYHIFVAACIAMTIVSSFYCAKYITGSTVASLTAMAVTVLYQYHIDDIYTRSAVGEFTASVFVPFIIAGIYDLVCKGFKKPQILGIGAVGVVLCHTITTGYCLIFCVLAFVFYIFGYFRSEKEISVAASHSASELIKPIFTLLLVLALTAFYWLPMLEQLLTTSFRLTESVFELDHEKLLVKDIFKNINPGMGIAPFILMLPGMFVLHRRSLRFADFCSLAGLLFTLTATGLIPWSRLQNELAFLQFPWRSFIVAGPLLALAAGIYIDRLISEGEFSGAGAPKLAILTVLAIMIASAVGNYSRNAEGYYSYSDDYYEYARYTENVIGGEWLPEGAENRHRLSDDVGIAYASSGSAVPVRRDRNSLYIDLNHAEEYLDVPFLYYRGYEAVNTDTGEVLRAEAGGENGRIRVYTKGARHIFVHYPGTILQHLSTLLSLAALIFLVVFFIIKRSKNKGSTE